MRVIGPSTQRERNRVLAAVRLVNAALPEDSKISVDAPRSGLSLQHTVSGNTYLRSGDELADTIHIEFVPRRSSASGTGAATTWSSPDHAYVQFYTGSNSYRDDRQSVILLAHEIMHSIGIDLHVSQSFQTIMEDTSQIHSTSQEGLAQPMSLLYPIDREALRALHGRLQDSNDPTAFGPWSSTSLHIHGNGPHVGFGVALRNGYGEPWAYGYLQNIGLDENSALSGTATWSGQVLGLTPSAEAVAGDADIQVNVTSMTGTTAFTNLEHWAPNAAPGDPGTGTQWLDGDLHYLISVDGFTFQETGGDDGRLTGIFVGYEYRDGVDTPHVGAAGTLERDDLTAAFGATLVCCLTNRFNLYGICATLGHRLIRGVRSRGTANIHC